jgi:hypothetical protein
MSKKFKTLRKKIIVSSIVASVTLSGVANLPFDSFSSLEKLGLGIQTAQAAATTFAGGTGTVSNPYLISNANQLDLIRNYLSQNVYFKLTSDIDLSSYAKVWTGNTLGWNPIGTDWAPFIGHLDGDGHVIKNLKIDRSNSKDMHTGLFGFVWNGATIKNLVLADVDIQANNYIGSLAGKTGNAIIDNVTVTGSVKGLTGWTESTSTSGGLIGYAYETEINNSNFSGKVENNAYAAGGLVGWYDGISSYSAAGRLSKANLTGSFSTGEVVSDFIAGGLVGRNDNYAQIKNSFSTANVNGPDSVGGLVGINLNSFIENTYATGNVVETVRRSGYSTHQSGGLVGGLTGGRLMIQNSYAIGKIIPIPGTGVDKGGVVGYNGNQRNKPPFTTGIYWDKEASNFTGIGPQPGNGTYNPGLPKTTAEMKNPATFVGWENVPVWILVNGKYPELNIPNNPHLPKENPAQKAIDALQALVATGLTTQAQIDASNAKLTEALAIVNALPDGQSKTDLLNKLSKLKTQIDLAKDILNAKNAVANATTLATSDLSTQLLIDSAKQAIADAQALVNKLPDGDIKTGLQNSLNDGTAKIQLAQDILNAKNSVDNATTLATSDLSTQALIDSAKQAIVDAQTLVNKLPDGDIKTGLQTSLNDDTVKIQLAQDILNAKNGVANATTLATSDLSTQELIDSAKQAIVDAQTLVNKLPDGDIKTGLQNSLNDDTATVQLAQDILNAKNGVAKATDASNEDLSTQPAIDTAKQTISEAQVLVDKLPVGDIKSGLQTQLDTNTVKVNTGQATLDVQIAEQAKTQVSVDTANASIAKLTDGDVKTSLTNKIAIVQQYININNGLNSILNGTLNTYEIIDASITTLNTTKAILDTYPIGTDKDTLTAKYQETVNYIENALETLLKQKQTGKPLALSNTSLEFLVKYAIQKVGATSVQDRGNIHGYVMPLLKGKATGDQVNQIIDTYFDGTDKSKKIDFDGSKK